MDETCIYLDCPSNYTYSERGVRRVKASTAGGERTRLSSVFTAAATGQKLPIYSIVPRVHSIPELDNIENMQFDYKTQSTFNDSMIMKYLERIIIPYVQSRSYERVLLIIDRATCHTTAKVSHLTNLVMSAQFRIMYLAEADMNMNNPNNDVFERGSGEDEIEFGLADDNIKCWKMRR